MASSAPIFGVLPAAAEAEFRPGNLEAKFVAPPFTVLDTRQGYWQERRRAWLSLGIASELGRGADLLSLLPAEEARARWAEGAVAVQGGQGTDLAAPMRATIARRQAMERQREPGYRYDEQVFDSSKGRSMQAGKGNYRSDGGLFGTAGKPGLLQKGLAGDRATDERSDDELIEQGAGSGGTSIFDPVLCELAYRWWAPEHGRVLDPFAGGSVRGIVAAKLGHPYTGVDLSAAQLEANRGQAVAILAPGEPAPQWLVGDSAHLDDLLPAGNQYDLVFTCPPYFDLEVYSSDPADLSNAPTYATFLQGYGQVIARAAARLLPERFMVLVVSEIRDPDGYCRGFVPDTVAAAVAAGLHLYNEAVLVNSAGSLPLRVTKYMESSRKLGRAHQNVLCFIKGSPPRGWSYDRVAPPNPQLSLPLEPEPVELSEDPVAQAVAAVEAAEVEQALQDEMHELVLEAMVAHVDQALPVPAASAPSPAAAEPPTPVLAPTPEPPTPERPLETPSSVACARRYCVLPGGHAMPHELVAPAEPEPVAIATAAAPVWEPYDEGRMLDPATGELAELPPWDAATWQAADPDRRCYTCGAAPLLSRNIDGSPRYDCDHAPVIAAGQVGMFGAPEP